MSLLTELQSITSASLPYLLSIPVNNKPNQRFPVLCFLHGHGEAALLNIFEALTRHGPLNPKNLEHIKQNFIIIAPQMPQAGDLWYLFSNQVYEIVQNVQKDYNGDFNRTYLTGFSFGGNGVFDVAEVRPDFWAALWPVDLTRVPTKDSKNPIWISIGSAARYNKKSFIEKFRLKSAANETLFGDRIYLDENEDHVGSARLAYKDERIYQWLLSQKLNSSDSKNNDK